MIRKKLEDRGVPEGVTNQRHFDNITDKFIATILSKDGVTNLTVPCKNSLLITTKTYYSPT
ncbi:MAG: hypothetical protein ACWIPH_06190 [Ostreibacterium sp.]